MKIDYYTKLRYCVILSITFVGTGIRLIIFDEFAIKWHLLAALIQFINLACIWESMRLLNNFLNKKLPFENDPKRRIIIQLFCVTLFAIIITTPVIKAIEYFSPFPVNHAYRVIIIISALSILMSINLGYIGAYFFDQWKKSLLKSLELEKEKSVVQYQNLLNQLNPHFFFNSLTSLNSLIYKDQQLASDFLQQLSKIYRYMLENKDKELVTLESEINFVKNYIELLKTRFRNGLIVEIEISEKCYEKLIVPVTLQIMIENALKHNIIDEDSPLTINVHTEDNYLFIENNLQRKNRIEGSHNQGLTNYKNLYQYLSPMRAVEAIEIEGKFVVKIPLL